MRFALSRGSFIAMDRAFWGVWALLPVYVGVLVSDVLRQKEQIAALLPDAGGCLRDMPLVVGFSAAGQIVFWGLFAAHVLFFVAILAMAHRVIHACARGRMFVEPLVRTLRDIGVIIALYPAVDLLLENLSQAAYVATGDMPAFLPSLALDVTVCGVGLLLVTLAMAMRQAMALQQDADLTI